MKNTPPPARLLDLTRLVRRAGRILTGVDRVEIAYLDALAADYIPVFGLIRTPFGYILLAEDGVRALGAMLRNPDALPAPDLMSRLQRGLMQAERSAQTAARSHALARALPHRLQRLLQKHLPQGTNYINVGHSNLTERVLSAVRSLGGQSVVMVHDTIPLDLPQYQRAGTMGVFREKLKRVRLYADLIVYNSADTQARAEVHMQAWGDVPKGIVSHLGTDVAVPNPGFERPKAPYFVTIGTIEPRKNHAFLLDIWDEMGPGAPELHIVGARGWNNDDVFARLDALPQEGPVFERYGLNDADMAALLQGAAGFLFPSFGEGFGLPPAEAAALGVPVISNELAVVREILGDIPVYASVSDRYLWIKTIKQFAGDDPGRRKSIGFFPSDWTEHFNKVLRLI